MRENTETTKKKPRTAVVYPSVVGEERKTCDWNSGKRRGVKIYSKNGAWIEKEGVVRSKMGRFISSNLV